MQPDQHLVDVVAAERLTGLAKATLYKLAREGRIRSFKVLSALRFEQADLLALVKERGSTSGEVDGRGQATGGGSDT
jgi:hypothetical protein